MSTRPVQTPAPTPGQLRASGTLLRDAELRFTVGAQRHAFLRVEFGTGAGLPYLATQDLGTEPLQHLAAEAKARLLRQGRRVTVYAAGATFRSDHDSAALRLVDVTDLVVHDLPAPTAGHAAAAPAEESSHDA